jgi:beta-RFAP synthase
VKVIVQAPARLHLGFIDLNGECGRVYGSLGVAVSHPRWLLEARRSDRTEAYGESAAEIQEILERVKERLGLDGGITIRVLSSIPRHMGFGSGTQLELSVAAAAARLSGRSLSARDLAALLGRGARSGIGVAVFERGGFVVDAGRPGAMAGAERQPAPPVIFQHPLPEDWTFVLVTPASAPGLSGGQEEGVFDRLSPMGEEQVGRICRLILMKVIPGVVTNDIRGFGEAVTEIQALVGEHFAPYQGGVYACAAGERVAEFALKRGAHGVGQSSWGPTVFALVGGEADAAELAREIRALLGHEGASVICARASNKGAECREEL